MDDGDGDGPREPPYDLGLAFTGAAELAEAAFRSTSRWFELMSTRWPDLSRLGEQATTGEDATARRVLRDEVIGLMREMAEISWQEMRAGIARFDEATRPTDEAPGPARPYRQKH